MSECKLDKKAYLKLIEEDIDFLKRNLSENLFGCIYTGHIIDVLKESVDLLYPENNDFIIEGQVFPATGEELRYKGMVYIISNLFNDVITGIPNHSKVEMRVKVIDKKEK